MNVTVAPRTITVADRQIRAMALLRPEGAHLCEIDLGGPNSLLLTVGEVQSLRAALDAFTAEQVFDDAGPAERRAEKRKPLGEF